MANSWFRFKQFTVHQDRCAMKVGTDGALLGALAPVPLKGKILDIGTGTGVVALMLAQRSDVEIDAVEIDAVEVDEGAARQAAENIRDSPWSDSIQVIHADFRDFYQSWKKRSRSEERRVGKECVRTFRSGWSPVNEEKKEE